MNKESLKAQILSEVSKELDQWIETEPTLKTGFDWEATLIKHTRKINQIILQSSLGDVPINRNKKNFQPV